MLYLQDVLTIADWFTTLAKSSNESTSVLRNFFLRSPKQVSGENLICPAGKNEMVMEDLTLSLLSTLGTIKKNKIN